MTRIHRIFCSAALAFAVAPAAVAEPGKEVIVPDAWKSAYEQLHYAPAVRAGDWLILSGVVAGFGPDPVDTDQEAAYVRAFEAIGAILKEGGADWDDVVEFETFHTDLPGQIVLFGEVKDRYVKEPYPAWTAIDIDRLYPDRGIVEIKVTAYLGE
jgi:enamine deaminase RidA (YjgF/YER057c/UK114 family)